MPSSLSVPGTEGEPAQLGRQTVTIVPPHITKKTKTENGKSFSGLEMETLLE